MLTIGRVADETAKDDEDVVDVEFPHDGVGVLLVGGHGLTDPRNVRVVPSVVVHQDGPVGHRRDLIAVVPPGHDLGVLFGIHAQPP